MQDYTIVTNSGQRTNALFS